MTSELLRHQLYHLLLLPPSMDLLASYASPDSNVSMSQPSSVDQQNAVEQLDEIRARVNANMHAIVNGDDVDREAVAEDAAVQMGMEQSLGIQPGSSPSAAPAPPRGSSRRPAAAFMDVLDELADGRKGKRRRALTQCCTQYYQYVILPMRDTATTALHPQHHHARTTPKGNKRSARSSSRTTSRPATWGRCTTRLSGSLASTTWV